VAISKITATVAPAICDMPSTSRSLSSFASSGLDGDRDNGLIRVSE
jgi:hypothetical protein